MQKIYLAATLLALSYCLPAQSIKDLDFLVGTWDTHEVIYEGTPKEYIETGERVCAYYMDSTYIKCETKGLRKGKPRTYAFLFNYDAQKKHFQLLKIFGDYSFYANKSWKIDWEQQLILEEDTGGDQYIGNIDFADPNRIIWRGWFPSQKREPKLSLIFTETATRK